MFFLNANKNTAQTIIHRLHPFSKIFVGVALSGLALFLRDALALAMLLCFVIIVYVMARVRPSRKQWLFMFFFLSVISTLNFLATRDVIHATMYALRAMVFMTAMPIFTATTDPQKMVQALSSTPLPAGIVMAVLLVWRFFPLMAGEAKQMGQASLLRGKHAGGLITKVYRGLLVPLVFCVIEYSDRITLALELRGFTPDEKRTNYRTLVAGKSDIVFCSIALVFLCVSAWLQWG